MRPAAAEAAAAPHSTRAGHRAVRRAAILEATVRILVTRGLAAVTHRAVAREAGVPLAATTYYFSSKDELIAEALDLLATDEIERLRERAEMLGDRLRSPEAFADGLTEVLVPDEASARALLAKFEVYLEAARSTRLRATAGRWMAAFAQLADGVLESVGVAEHQQRGRLLVAAVDGLLIQHLATPDRPGAALELRRDLERAFALLSAC